MAYQWIMEPGVRSFATGSIKKQKPCADPQSVLDAIKEIHDEAAQISGCVDGL